MRGLLTYTRALVQMYQNFHWKASGVNSYGDHELYQRLYDGVHGEIDQLAERILGTGGDLDPVTDGAAAAKMLDGMTSNSSSAADFPAEAVKAEETYLELIKKVLSADTSDGVDDLLQGIASLHEEHLFLLRQRAKTAGRLVQNIKTASNSALIKALKENNAEEAKRAIFDVVANSPSGSTPSADLGLTDDEFRNLSSAVQGNGPVSMDTARSILGVGRDIAAPEPEDDEDGAEFFSYPPYDPGPVQNPYTNNAKKDMDFRNSRTNQGETITDVGKYRIVSVPFNGSIHRAVIIPGDINFSQISPDVNLDEMDIENALTETFGETTLRSRERHYRRKATLEEAHAAYRRARRRARGELRRQQEHKNSSVISQLCKLATELDKQSQFDLSSEVDEVVRELTQRSGLKLEDITVAANHMDSAGYISASDILDTAANKGK